jgi:hypothetical protein
MQVSLIVSVCDNSATGVNIIAARSADGIAGIEPKFI